MHRSCRLAKLTGTFSDLPTIRTCSHHKDYVAIGNSKLRDLLYQWGRGYRHNKQLPKLSSAQVCELKRLLDENQSLKLLCLQGILGWYVIASHL